MRNFYINYLKLFTIFLMVMGCFVTQAATRTWVGSPAGGVWTTAANWNGGGTAPAVGDDIVFNLTAGCTITAVPAMSINSLTAEGAFKLTLTGGVLMVSNGITIANALDITSGTTLVIGNGSSIATTGLVTILSGGALNLNGQNCNFAGGLNIRGTGIGTTGAIINSSGTASSISNNTAMSADSSIGTSSGDITISGVISGGSALTKLGTGKLILSGANSYTGATTISAGVLNIQNTLATGTSAGGVSITSGTALEMQGNISVVSETITINGTGIGGAGALRNISGSNSWSGTITQGSASRINSDAGTLTLAAISGLFGLTIGGAGNTTVSGIIGTGNNSLTKDGAGTLTLSGANTYTGATTITAGTLQLGAADRLAGTQIILNGGTFSTGVTTGFSDAIPSTLRLTDNSILNFGTGNHTLIFNASNLVAWTGAKTLTINGWSGTIGASGTAGKLVVGTDSSGLTAIQLSQIIFSVSGESYSAKMLSNGEVVPDVKCSSLAPTAQPTQLYFTSINKTVVEGAFIGTTPLANYLIVRTTSPTAVSNPVNGTTYTVGASALGGTIVANSSSTSFLNTGLTANTTYIYTVFSYYKTCGTGSPNYNTSSPLSASVITLSFTKLYLNDNSQSGDVYCTAIGSNSNNGLSPNAPKLTLKAVYDLAVAGDIIYVDTGSYSGGDNENRLTDAINKAGLQIIGAGEDLTIFEGPGGPTTIRWLTISGNNIKFSRMTVTKFTGGDGIAIQITSGTGIELSNMLIYGNVGSTGQGAVLITGNSTSVTINKVSSHCNRIASSNYGGGYKINGSTVVFNECTIASNVYSQAQGGGIKIEGNTANVTINKTIFEDNEASGGGGMSIWNGTVNINNSCFTNNRSSSLSAAPGGGAVLIRATGNGLTTTVNFNNCIFEGNSTNEFQSNGGAVIITNTNSSPNCNVNFTTCSFNNNSANVKGEDVYFDYTGTFTGTYNIVFKNTTFETKYSGTQVNLYNEDIAAAQIKFEALAGAGGNGDIVADGSGVAISKPEFSSGIAAPAYTETSSALPVGLPVTFCEDRFIGTCGGGFKLFCTKDPVTGASDSALRTNIGFSTLSTIQSESWPHNIPNGLLVMESKNKGFVLTRMSDTERNNIPTPIEGMLIYNTTVHCLQIFNGVTWRCMVETCVD